jgi:hypothetical protein
VKGVIVRGALKDMNCWHHDVPFLAFHNSCLPHGRDGFELFSNLCFQQFVHQLIGLLAKRIIQNQQYCSFGKRQLLAFYFVGIYNLFVYIAARFVIDINKSLFGCKTPHLRLLGFISDARSRNRIGRFLRTLPY